MLKRTNPDIVIGILIASLFWVGVFVWQSSQPPYEAGQKSERCEGSKAECAKASVDERLANYTWWLAALTFGLVVTAIGQGYFLLRADRTARIAAEAAKKSADHIPNVERAYVFFSSATSGDITTSLTVDDGGYPFLVKYSFKNSGRTPAIMKRIQIGAEYLESGLPTGTKFTYGDGILPAPLIVGSDHTPLEHDIQLWITGPDYEKAKVATGRIFFWGKLNYLDVFGASHETGICSEWHFGQSRFVISTDCAELNYYT